MSSSTASSSQDGSKISTLPSNSIAEITDPELYTCASLMTALTEQLQAQLDVNSEYMLLQRQLERSHNNSMELLEGVSRRVVDLDKYWQECIRDTVNVRDRIVDEIRPPSSEAIEPLAKVDTTKKLSDAEKLALANSKNNELKKSIAEAQHVGNAVDFVHNRVRFDHQRLRELEAKMREVMTLEENISRVLERDVKVAQQIQMKRAKKETTYGICELTTGYKQLMRHLGTAGDLIDNLKTRSNEYATPVPGLSPQKLNYLATLLTKLTKMLECEISNVEYFAKTP
uniref:Uncharacterized protein n=1 Tax=Panagrellus redivivus TaxID=6233 RepID=A0A7E4US92_PANRE